MKQSEVIKKVKEIVNNYDFNAAIFLFGSRARGDWSEESDWDFLVLSEFDEASDIKEKIRKDVFNKIEMNTFEDVYILFHNKKIWEDDHAVTNIYQSISEDGIQL